MRQVGAEESCAPLDGGGGVSVLGESRAPTPPGSPRGDVPPRASGATVPVVPGGSIQRGKDSDFSMDPKLPVFRGSSYDSLPNSSSLLSAIFRLPFSLSMLEELIRRQLRVLSLLANLFSAPFLWVFPSSRTERPRGTEHKQAFFLVNRLQKP